MSDAASHPLVSVVTPCLNAASFLPRCLASVREQTYPNVEHLVMDGGSSDGTRSLLESSSGIAWVSEPDGGQTAAINKGWRLARGDVLTWLNADDYLFPDAVETIVAALSKCPEAGWAIGRSHIEEADGSREVPPPRHLSLRDLDKSNPVVQPAAFMTRLALERVGPLDESLDLVMDLDLWYRLLLLGFRPVMVPQTVAGILIHKDTKTLSRPQSEYATEFGLVRLRHGRQVAGSIWLGRAAAHLASAEHGPAALRCEVARVATLASEHGLRTSLPAVRAGARTQAAYLEATTPRRLHYLIAPSPWRYGMTRGVILQAALTRLRRLRWPPRARRGERRRQVSSR